MLLDGKMLEKNALLPVLFDIAKSGEEVELWKQLRETLNLNYDEGKIYPQDEEFAFEILKKDAKVCFFHQCSKMQIIPIKKLNIQTCFFQFLWFFRLKC